MSFSNRIASLQMRIARLERLATQNNAWLNAKFSVGGSRPTTGRQILAENEGAEEVREALIEAFKTGSFDGFNMESIKLVSKR